MKKGKNESDGINAHLEQVSLKISHLQGHYDALSARVNQLEKQVRTLLGTIEKYVIAPLRK